MHNETLWAFFLRAAPRIKLRLAALGLAGVLIASGTVWAIGTILWVQWNQPAPDDAPTVAEEKEDAARAPTSIETYVYTYELKNISIVLINRRGTRTAYAQFSLVLDCPNAESARQMKLDHAKLLDTIFDVAATYYLDDFALPTGFASFKGSLLARYKADFKDVSPRDIAIRDWVMN